MKVQIIGTDKNIKKCVKCGNTIFRKSTKSKYTNKQKTKGVTYTLLICNKCGYRQVLNKVKWNIKKC